MLMLLLIVSVALFFIDFFHYEIFYIVDVVKDYARYIAHVAAVNKQLNRVGPESAVTLIY